ncbi:MAG: HAD family phosphatase [Anaerolineales bacterium]|nr:HAD family phosphatase [Anaerolineales bacterium]
MLKALIFDFDGLILDTETPEFLVWQGMYRELGLELPMDEWRRVVGGYGVARFDPAEDLVRLSHGRLDYESLRERYRAESSAIIQSAPMLPGVTNWLDEAQTRGLRLAIGSSSSHDWVDGNTQRLGIYDRFDFIVCNDDVAPGQTKPHPDIYLKALELLQVKSSEAVVFEDSLNGVAAARAAGIFAVAVPNPLTAQMGVSGDLTLSSLADLTLPELEENLK